MEVKAYDSFEEMQQAQAEAHEQATALTTQAQRALLKGQGFFWFQWVPEYDMSVWGERWSVSKYATYLELKAQEAELKGDPEDAAAWRDTIESDVENLARGYLSGKAWSLACDYGELGDTHVMQVVEIPSETFELARAHHWDIKALLRDPDTRAAAITVTDAWNAMIVDRADLIEALIALREKDEIAKTISEVLHEEGS
jgi:hypothetical protein